CHSWPAGLGQYRPRATSFVYTTAVIDTSVAYAMVAAGWREMFQDAQQTRGPPDQKGARVGRRASLSAGTEEKAFHAGLFRLIVLLVDLIWHASHVIRSRGR